MVYKLFSTCYSLNVCVCVSVHHIKVLVKTIDPSSWIVHTPSLNHLKDKFRIATSNAQSPVRKNKWASEQETHSFIFHFEKYHGYRGVFVYSERVRNTNDRQLALHLQSARPWGAVGTAVSCSTRSASRGSSCPQLRCRAPCWFSRQVTRLLQPRRLWSARLPSLWDFPGKNTRVLEYSPEYWAAISFTMGSSWPRDWTPVSCWLRYQ